MPDKKCPHCGLWSTDSALQCDCGYDFVSNTVKEPYSALPHPSKEELNERGKKDMMYGALLFVGGLIVTGVSYAAASNGGTYVIAYGAVIYGLIQFVRGILEARKGQAIGVPPHLSAKKITNFKTQPFFIAIGASLVMQVVVVIYINGIILPKTTLTVTSAIIITTLDQFLVHALAGGLYSFLSTREGPFSVRAGAAGGAIAGALGRLVGSPISFFMASGLFHSVITGEKALPLEELYPGLTIELAIIGGLCSVVLAMLVAAMLGAAGGAIVAAIAKYKTAPA
ncbi:MAG TPA: hypothetical protein VKP08_23070 [Anaerolineales bacterium]|nr:hypothetical protein [Anaerolineales bacterium]